MKKGIHPEEYRTVVFQDFSVDKSWLGKSAANTKDTIQWEDGNEYPLIKLEISSASHPFLSIQRVESTSSTRSSQNLLRRAKLPKKQRRQKQQRKQRTKKHKTYTESPDLFGAFFIPLLKTV